MIEKIAPIGENASFSQKHELVQPPKKEKESPPKEPEDPYAPIVKDKLVCLRK